MSGTFAPDDPFPLPWDQARQDLTHHLRSRAHGVDPQQLDDLVQEACVRLLRASRRQTVREPAALLATVAHRTWVDFVRRSRRTRERFTQLGDDADRHAAEGPDPDAELGHLLDRFELVVQEVFARRQAGACAELARSYFAGHDWHLVARDAAVSHASVRKRWSRCLATLREDLGADPDFADLFPAREGTTS